MLKIVGLADYDGQIERLAVDHTPPIFNVRVGRAQHHSEPPAIWRVEVRHDDGAGTGLLDIWVRRSDGSIRDLELVVVPKECIELVDDGFEFLKEGACGLPIADMALWQDSGVEMWGWGKWSTVSERLPLRLFVGRYAYSLRIGDDADIGEVIVFGEFRLGLDDAHVLRRIDVVDVGRDKIESLLQWRNRPASSLPPSKVGSTRRLR